MFLKLYFFISGKPGTVSLVQLDQVNAEHRLANELTAPQIIFIRGVTVSFVIVILIYML